MRFGRTRIAHFCNLVNKQFTQNYEEPTFARLQSRSFIIVNGPETKKFLQGLTTNNINQLYDPKLQKVAQYTLFLSPKGKIISDAIILRPLVYENGVKKPVQNELWIDIAKDTSTALFEHLRKYTWKKQVEISNLGFEDDAPEVTAGFNKVLPQKYKALDAMKDRAGTLMEIETAQSGRKEVVEDGGYANIAYFDPRGLRLGIRMLCDHNGFVYKGKIKRQGQKQYEKVLRLHGISSAKAMVNKLPFMFNSDLYNGFSFNKGCYLGQELVARAYHTGIVRRRIFPFTLSDSNAKIQPGQTLYGENNVQLGKVVESDAGYGTVLCNYLPLLENNWPIKIQKPVQGLLSKPFESQLKHYIDEIKAKQAKLEEIDL